MSKKRVLIVTHEMKPYLILSEVSKMVHQLPIYLNDNNYEVRILMPKFGTINERRHRLHEVVRLSGINIIIDDDDYPLIIKVASLPGARLQVYFLDNDEFFRRKHNFKNDTDDFFDDNGERMVFFCKGVMETIKKFGWPPDILHCHGWFTSLIPLYAKTAYKKEAVFHNSKVLYSAYENQFEQTLGKNFVKKATISKEISDKDFASYKKGTNAALNVGAIEHADGVVLGADVTDKNVRAAAKKNKHVLDLKGVADQMAAHLEFYNSLVKK